ncbi:MucR family transcriptional regulator [Corynebacterium sp. zg-331]|uniref:MucR family transcriptional regulator n=1 Tax=unclassified Corynebacterium TaxID=2624378 RepID=UPI00164302FD|nr:MucR family transcriptional regulator [Corynebacterium sp. zg-331]
MCKVPGCHKPIFTKKSGLCGTHYKQQRNGRLEDSAPPPVGSLDGYGLYGILDDDGQTVLCHECGFRYPALGNHVFAVHEMTARDYKVAHGLPKTRSLNSTAVSKKQSKRAKERVGSAGWKAFEARRDPVMASHSRDEEAFKLPAARDFAIAAFTQNLTSAGRAAKKHTCPICEASYTGSGATCGDEVCRRLAREKPLDLDALIERVYLIEVEGCSYSEAGRRLGISHAAVRNSYLRYKRRLENQRVIARRKGPHQRSCVVCGDPLYNNNPQATSCGDPACRRSLLLKNTQINVEEARARVQLIDVEGMTFMAAARKLNMSHQALRRSYRAYKKQQRDLVLINHRRFINDLPALDSIHPSPPPLRGD